MNQHGPGGQPLIADRSLFAAFTDCDLHALDISGYEGADIICDVCGKIPRRLRGRFDFVIDGGSLDNVFDPARAIANMCNLLAPGGRIFIFAWGNSFPTAYLKFSPDWLMDYFAVNEFADCKTYVLQYEREGAESRLSAWQYDPHEINSGSVGYECSQITTLWPSETFCIAESGKKSTTQRNAVQKHYRGKHTQPYLTSIERFRASPRPLFRSPLSIALRSDRQISPYRTMRQVAEWPPHPSGSDPTRPGT